MAIASFSKAYTKVATYYDNLDEVKAVFNVTPKFRMLQHVADRCADLNPRYGWCYSGEDYMHICRTLTQSCVRATKRAAVQGKVLTKYKGGLHVQMCSDPWSR